VGEIEEGGRADAMPGRRSTPRPTYEAAAVIRRRDTAHHVWGDTESGLVTDRVYVSSSALHVLEFGLEPGGAFRHSATNKTVFAADVMYCVLEGELVLADPQHGEVRVVPAGDQVLFRRDTWHHGFNPSQTPLRVLEFFAPPPSMGTASQYARHQANLEQVQYRDPRWSGRWPEARDERLGTTRLDVVQASDAVWGFASEAPTHLVGLLADTEHLTVTTGRVYAGHVEDPRKVEDESLLVVTSGELWVDVQEQDGDRYATDCLLPGDAMYVPAHSTVRVLSRSGQPSTYLMGSGRPVEPGWAP